MCFIVKYVMFLANFIFTLAGLALIALGTVVYILTSQIRDLISISFNFLPITVIVLGVIIFLVSFFGCCGSIRENRCLLGLYSICTLLLAGGKIYVSVVLLNNLYKIGDLTAEWIGEAFLKDNLRDPFKVMEATFKCCGTIGPDSYESLNLELPVSCCPNPGNIDTCAKEDAFGGCNRIVADFLARYGEAAVGVIVTVVVVEFVAVLAALVLCCWIGRKNAQDSEEPINNRTEEFDGYGKRQA